MRNQLRALFAPAMVKCMGLGKLQSENAAVKNFAHSKKQDGKDTFLKLPFTFLLILYIILARKGWLHDSL